MKILTIWDHGRSTWLRIERKVIQIYKQVFCQTGNSRFALYLLWSKTKKKKPKKKKTKKQEFHKGVYCSWPYLVLNNIKKTLTRYKKKSLYTDDFTICYRSKYIHTTKNEKLQLYIIIIMMSCRQHGYPWPSLATSPYHSSPYVGVHRSTSLMSSSLLLQHCPACLVRLTCIVFLMGGKWPYINSIYKWAKQNVCIYVKDINYIMVHNRDLREQRSLLWISRNTWE